MQDIRLAGLAGLSFVCAVTDLESTQDHRDFFWIKIGIQQIPELKDGFGISCCCLHGPVNWRGKF